MKQVFVRKSSGELEPYNRSKILSSLLKSGVDNKTANTILKLAEKSFYNGITTSEIHSIIQSLLKKYAFGLHARYNIKQSLFALGPTGYPFEKFVARVLEEYGYETKVDVILAGKCVSHEIDVVATKGNKFRLVECKFHNSPGTKTNVKVPLYVKARFDDVMANPENNREFSKKEGGPWIFTNTKFTSDAISYAECVGIRVTAWNYPKRDGIQNIIENKALYPITIFSDVPKDMIVEALEEGIITVKDFLEEKGKARRIFREFYLRLQIEAKGLIGHGRST